MIGECDANNVWMLCELYMNAMVTIGLLGERYADGMWMLCEYYVNVMRMISECYVNDM